MPQVIRSTASTEAQQIADLQALAIQFCEVVKTLLEPTTRLVIDNELVPIKRQGDSWVNILDGLRSPLIRPIEYDDLGAHILHFEALPQNLPTLGASGRTHLIAELEKVIDPAKYQTNQRQITPTEP